MIDGPARLRRILVTIWKPLVGLAVLDLIVTAAVCLLQLHPFVPSNVPLPLLGTGLVVFLGMRNSTAYARWWEARTLWGSVVNQSRNFARSTSSLLAGDDGQLRRSLILHQVAWAKALRHSLRREDATAGLSDLISNDARARLQAATNVPFAIQREIGDQLGEAMRADRLDSMQFNTLNTILSALTDAQGGLERIRNTPMPNHYVVLPHLFVLAYCVLLPFGVVADLNWFTPIACLIINSVFLTLDRAGANLQDPFARSIHELPMTAISRTVEIDLKEAISHENPPSPIRAVRGVLR